MFLQHLLHHGGAIQLGHAQVEHHDIGLVLFVELERLGAVAGLGHHLHVRLLVDDGREAVAHHWMVVGKDDADLRPDLRCRRAHQQLRCGIGTMLGAAWPRGTRTRMTVPASGVLTSCQRPPIASARSRMLVRPKPCCAYSSGAACMPQPSSLTDSTSMPSSQPSWMRMLRGWACRTALMTASCAMRSSACSCSGGRPVAAPPPSKREMIRSV